MRNVYRVREEWEDKCWGKVQHIFLSEASAVSHLVVRPNWQCSKHRHGERANMFCVQSGIIEVLVWDEQGNKSEHLLTVGDVLVVPSGVWHRFRVLEGGRIIEVYFVDVVNGSCRFEDIERQDQGGRCE